MFFATSLKASTQWNTEPTFFELGLGISAQARSGSFLILNNEGAYFSKGPTSRSLLLQGAYTIKRFTATIVVGL
jgi:hypothetical protein